MSTKLNLTTLDETLKKFVLDNVVLKKGSEFESVEAFCDELRFSIIDDYESLSYDVGYDAAELSYQEDEEDEPYGD